MSVGEHTDPSGVIIECIDNSNLQELWTMEPCKAHLKNYLPNYPEPYELNMITVRVKDSEDSKMTEWW